MVTLSQVTFTVSANLRSTSLYSSFFAKATHALPWKCTSNAPTLAEYDRLAVVAMHGSHTVLGVESKVTQSSRNAGVASARSVQLKKTKSAPMWGMARGDYEKTARKPERKEKEPKQCCHMIIMGIEALKLSAEGFELKPPRGERGEGGEKEEPGRETPGTTNVEVHRNPISRHLLTAYARHHHLHPYPYPPTCQRYHHPSASRRVAQHC